ncbi:diguanylate cyclase [Photobacterium japonica]|uniref:tetratricopeptide repeat-containing diguanylate cyclase n=1 Tax=Photobacterium japonica TaxID=2910235 RepID=UPI003D12970A
MYNLMTNNNRPYNNQNNVLPIEKKYIGALISSTNANHYQSTKALTELLKDAITSNNKQLEELLNYQLCKIENKFGRYVTGEKYCNNLLTMINKINHITTVQKHDAYIVIAMNKTRQGLYSEALDIYNSIIKSLPLYVPPVSAYNNIALILIDLKRYDEAERYLDKAMLMLQKDPSSHVMAQVYHSVAQLHALKGRKEEAIDMYKNALTLIGKGNNFYGISSLYLGLGDIYLGMADFVNAEKYINIARTVAQTGYDEDMLANSVLSLGLLFNKQSETEKALHHLKQALKMGEDFDNFEVKQTALKAISDIYFSVNDNLNAYLYYKQYANNLDYSSISQLPRTYNLIDGSLRERELYSENTVLKNELETMQHGFDKISMTNKGITLSLLLLLALLVMTYLLSKRKNAQLRHDPLTQALRREAILKEICDTPACSDVGHFNTLILIDLDHFKRVNDTYGHPGGDAVLTEVVRRLQQYLGIRGLVGRLGGEEFVVLIPNNAEFLSSLDIQRIHAAICHQPITLYGEHDVNITISSAFLNTELSLSTFKDLYFILDQALYFVKNNGRNATIDAFNDPIDLPVGAFNSLMMKNI